METGIRFANPEVHVVDPVGYFEICWLLERTALVLTDSGGLQKEASFFERPCVTLRDETEWTELIDAGVNVLAGADTHRILESSVNMLGRTIRTHGLYGDGDAAQRIIAAICSTPPKMLS